MGFPIRLYVGALAISQLSVIVLLGVNLWEQRQLRLQLGELNVGSLPGHRTGGQVEQESGGSGDPWPGSHTNSGAGPPKNPQVGQFPLGTLSGPQSREFSFGWWFLGLCLSLSAILGLGFLWIRVRAPTEPSLDPLSPTSQKEVAQRQLAELRLRRHGFGERKSAGAV